MSEEIKQEPKQTEDEVKEEKPAEEKLSKKEAKAEQKKAKKEDELSEKIEKLEADVAHWKNEYYKAYADTMNLRKSLEADKQTALRYRAEGFLGNLIPAFDAFHMALNSPVSSPEVKNYLVGFTYIYNQLIKALEDEGVTELEPKIGEDFDAATMHAMEAIEAPDVKPGTVIKVLTKGYKLHDRLIRPAMVNVAKAKTEDKKEEQAEAEEEKAEAAKA